MSPFRIRLLYRISNSGEEEKKMSLLSVHDYFRYHDRVHGGDFPTPQANSRDCTLSLRAYDRWQRPLEPGKSFLTPATAHATSALPVPWHTLCLGPATATPPRSASNFPGSAPLTNHRSDAELSFSDGFYFSITRIVCI